MRLTPFRFPVDADPTMHRMPPSEAHHARVHGAYDYAWHPPYPSSFDSNAPESRRSYFVILNRELPQPSMDGPFNRPSSLPGPTHLVPEPNPSHANYRPPINRTPHETSPHPPPPEYPSRLVYQEQQKPPSPSESTPASGPLPPLSQFMSPVPPILAGTLGPYDPSYYQNPAFGARQRKAARAQQACDQCRARKARCDEGRPACSHCKENDLACMYKEVPPHKQEKRTQLILDRLLEMEDKIANRLNSLQSIQAGHGRQVELLFQSQARSGASVPAPSHKPILKTPASIQSVMDAPDEKSPSQGPIQGQPAPPAQLADPMSASLEDPVNGDNEGELSIPVEHTTAAHKLLKWPSIKRLLYPDEYDEDYVMRLEEERGLISIYGQGEISYTADDTQTVTPPPTNDGAPGWDDQRPNGDGAFKDRNSSVPDDANAEITMTGLLRLHPDTARRYYQSFLDRMHKLHPFLHRIELDPKIQAFIQMYCVDDSLSLCRDNPRGAKRKRSSDDLHGFRGASAEPSSSSPRRVGRNIDSAIILLIFALGAICETKFPLPGPIMDDKVDYLNQDIPRPLPPPPPPPPMKNAEMHAANGVLSPANSDSALPSGTTMYMTPLSNMSQSFPSAAPQPPASGAKTTKNLSRTTISATRDEFGNSKNLQVIPGLALYGFATGILGHLQGGVELEHVQAGLLAGLYAGQLAHPLQSHGWICQAARACQVLVRQRRYERVTEGPVQDLYNFAYWTCLQLESDILAELDLPASGISRSESRMNLPRGTFTLSCPNDLNAPGTMMMFFYSAQVHLRKVLNRVHTDLYKVEKQGETRWSSSVQETLSMNLDLWRSSLPVLMRWDDKDPPDSNINAARMRAKYYGARYIIHRPLLYHALHYGQAGARVGAAGQTTVDSPTGSASASQSQQMSPSMTYSGYRPAGMSRILSDMGGAPTNTASSPNGWTPPKVKLRDLPQKLRRACKVCIESAILSTEAFDGIEDRLVVTNIFGTAHAQFGNMLVLAATYMSSLSELVDPSTLEWLLKRTIKFLIRYQNVSPTLRADARILTEIYLKIFRKHPKFD